MELNQEIFTLPIMNKDGEDYELHFFSPVSTCRMSLLKETKNVAWLSNLFVDDENKHKGHGNKMLDRMEEEAKRLGCDTLSLQVKHGTWMEDWYKRRGFMPVAYGYEQDMIILSKRL